VEVYRLTTTKYKDQLSGKGAAFKGGRWNSKGTEIIYTASNRSLAMAEVAVKLDSFEMSKHFHMLTIYIPDNLKSIEFSTEDLPNDWNSFPQISETQFIVDNIVKENKYGIIKVPSVVVLGDHNYLINPKHKSFNRIKIIDSVKFPFDDRLFYK